MRRILVLVLAALLSAPAVVCAIGLGNIEAHSALNQPFNARIPLIKATADEIDNLKVQLASPAQFQRAGIDLTSVLLSLQFKVKQAGKGPDYIEVTTHDSVREPFLNFLVEIDWPKGRLIREYTVLLDPPMYVPAQRAAVRPAATSTASTAVAASASVAPWQSLKNEVNVPGGTAPGQTTAATSGAVAAGDTLWSLADRMRPDESVSIQQMMLALLRANPDAFVQGNVNGLKKGFVLKMPARSDVNSISHDEALAEVKKQYAAWEQFREAAAKGVPAQSEGPVAQTETGAPQAATGGKAPAATDEAHLKLLSAKEGGAEEDVARQLAVAKETLDSKEQENDDLKSQLVESEQIIEKLKSRVALQDDQLAELQAKLSGMQAPAPEPAQAAAPAAAPPAAEKPTAPPVVETPAPAAEPVEAPKPAPMEKAETPPAKSVPAKAVGVAKSILDQATEIVSGFVPKAVLETLPGGVLTVLGGMAIVVLGLIALIVKVAGRGRNERPARSKLMTAAGRVEERSESVTQFDEPVTETRDEEAPTVGAFDGGGTTQLEVTQIAASTSAAPVEEDPLAEVNVYLAYERFDEAEKVVKDAIAKYPDEHKYKLRLLEVYYSSNNKAAYEDAARSLHDSVNGSGPLWDSAVAMWREMSPDRELFAAREEDRTVTAAESAPERQFVDITAGESQPPEAMSETVSDATGEPQAESRDTGGGIDFDLGSDETTAGEDILDLTADAGAADMLDITAAESAEPGEVLDLTMPAAEQEETPPAAEGAAPDLENTVDKYSHTASDDLLDVTKTGDISATEHGDLLNVTSPGSLGEAGGEHVLDITGSHEEPESENVIEFDLGGDLEAAPAAPADEGMIDITAGGSGADGEQIDLQAPEGDANMLEFDIGALEPDTDTGATPLELSEKETVNLSEQETVNLTGEDTVNLDESSTLGEGLEINLDDDSLSTLSEVEPTGDDTMDLDSADLSPSMDDMSLDDLTKSLEDTLTGLQKSQEPEEEGGDEFAFDLGGGDDAGDDQGEHLSTVQMGEEGEPTDELGAEKTVVMPTKDEAETQSAQDEADTKLNLAKAYIELGDTAGARTILNEVVAEGSAAQQDEARKLLQDIG